jgi:NAD(P)-dependent dehydrogenase (short-subunit alcohol dehydrogenase family)
VDGALHPRTQPPFPLHPEGTREFLKTLQPTGQYGTVQDIVDAVLYMTDAKFTTGVVLGVDGGASAGVR